MRALPVFPPPPHVRSRIHQLPLLSPPFIQLRPQRFHPLRLLGICGQVVELVRIVLQIVQLKCGAMGQDTIMGTLMPAS